MRARLENDDGGFVATVEVPDGTSYIRYGERFFVAGFGGAATTFGAVEVYVAPIEGSGTEP